MLHLTIKMVEMKQINRRGINYLAAHPKFEMNGNGQFHPWYTDKNKLRTVAGIAGFIVGSILTILLIRKG